jgi:hypothetical protein
MFTYLFISLFKFILHLQFNVLSFQTSSKIVSEEDTTLKITSQKTDIVKKQEFLKEQKEKGVINQQIL